MAKDILEELKDISTNVEISQSFLTKAKKAIKKANKMAEEFDRALLESDKESVASIAMNTAIEETLSNELEEIYTRNLDDAVGKSPEYSSDYYYVGLRNLVYSEKLVSVTKTGGSGFGKSVDVKLRMNEVAGDLADWSKAVEAARIELKVNKNRDPVKSSEFWKKSVFGTGLYDKTMQYRLGAVSYPAPFWSLLENGNAASGMESDIGGTPYPKHARPTRFVAYTERDLKRSILNKFRRSKESYDQWVKDTSRYRDELQKNVFDLYDLVNAVSSDLYVAKKVAREADRPISDIDSSKFAKALERARAGYTGRVDIGMTGKPRFRISLGKLYGL